MVYHDRGSVMSRKMLNQYSKKCDTREDRFPGVVHFPRKTSRNPNLADHLRSVTQIISREQYAIEQAFKNLAIY